MLLLFGEDKERDGEREEGRIKNVFAERERERERCFNVLFGKLEILKRGI